MRLNKKGFTLIELMIVVAIIGILAAVAVPKFADLINKSKEGATKGALSAVRGALQVYYSDNEGVYPSDIVPQLTPRYINEIPELKLPGTGFNPTREVKQYSSPTDPVEDVGKWGYYNHNVTTAPTYGWFGVACLRKPLTAPDKAWSEL